MLEYLFFALLGLLSGSVAHLLAYKLSKNLPLLSSPLHVPIFSFLKHKSKALSLVHYVLAELLGILISVACVYSFEDATSSLLMLLFFTTLLFLSFSDVYTFTIPDIVPIVGTIVGILSSFLRPDFSALDSIFGILLALLLTLPLYFYSTKVKKVEALGFGDVQVLVFIGSFTGPWGVLYAKILGTLLSFFYVLPIVLKYKNVLFVIPYVPFLSVGVFIGVVADFKNILLTL